ncbi:MAG: sigma-70 family RNA polymerase sigma factor [Clostridiales bacterium]|nr:sigma-70 family RNA polymerase sigma factor [Clostridiales bacterium]MBQ8352218.1 sigma-70 family RNA polymerase sigma factor [Clostridia bacterium]
MSENIHELFTKYRQTKDVAIRNQIAEKYLYIAEILAKKFVGRGVAYEDLVQEATMYLLEAIDSFDEARGLQFSTFATPTITGKLKNYFRDHARMVKVPRKLSELNLDIRRFAERYLAENGSVPEVRTIAAALNLSEEEVIEALEVGGTVSLDQQVGGDEDGRTLGDLLPAQDSGFERLELRETLAAAMDDFPELERKILQLRFIENLSQTETASRLNVSQMTVSRMERKALAKLKERLKNLL